jgi:tetratricopeptide (TPR) repeat protein
MLVTVAAVLGVSGCLLNGAIRFVTTRARPAPVNVRTLSAFDAFAALGGFRPLAADLVWISLQGAWERRDSRASESLVRTATRLDPETPFFWRNGARLIAFDVPLWRITEGGGWRQMPVVRQQEIRREQAGRALRLLDEAIANQPHLPALWLERAGIALHGAGDRAAAAACYQRAWELDPSLTFAARLHAQILQRLGRREEARAGLLRLARHLAMGSNPIELQYVQAWLAEIDDELVTEREKATNRAAE